MKDLLEYIVKSLVSKPDQIQIKEDLGEDAAIFSLTVAPEDMGIVIGKSGQTIKAIRKLLITRASAENQSLVVRLNLEEVDGPGSSSKEQNPSSDEV